jgi:hypothetical protein
MPLDCFVAKQTSAHMKIAVEEEVYAVIGLDTSYLFYEGDWKFIYPSKEKSTRYNDLIFMEYNRPKILDHLGLTVDQFRFFGLLAEKFFSKHDDPVNHQKLKEYFTKIEGNGNSHRDFAKLIDFVNRFTPPEKFPLQTETIDEILVEIFGDAISDEIRMRFIENMKYQPALLSEYGVRFNDEEISSLLAANPFATLAEAVLNVFPCIIASPFLDVNAKDLLQLKELTSGWLKRFSGVLLKHIESPKSFVVSYHVEDGKIESFDVQSESPECKL